MTEGIGFNLVSLHQTQARQTIILDKEGAHLFDRQLALPRNEIESCLYATRLDPTPTSGLTAVPAFSGVQPPPGLLVLNLPPRRVINPPPPLDAPRFV